MNPRLEFHSLLSEIGSGRSGEVAYDTAWIARLSELGEPIGEQALEWLRAHQLADGSWGTVVPRYHHDRVICTLAAMVALARRGQIRDRVNWQRARLALEMYGQGLGADLSGHTLDFELIAPALLAETKALDVIPPQAGGLLDRLSGRRAARLAALPEGVINRRMAVARSLEMASLDGSLSLEADDLQEADGSVAHSPSATAYFALQVRRGDPAALAYLRKVAGSGGAPGEAPFDVFERARVLWNLALLGPLDAELSSACQPHLDFLQTAWEPGRGVGTVADCALKDGGDTGVTYEVLSHFGRPVDLAAVLYHEEDDCFARFASEIGPFIGANVHVLGALRKTGLRPEHPVASKVLRFLERTQSLRLFWSDRGHTSPYYTTAHAIIACAGFAGWLVDDAVYWISSTQLPDGSWGYYGPTAEETAYCLQALTIWRRRGGRAPKEALERGADWLAKHAEPPYPPLWIGKCLWCPELVVRSSILGALMLVGQV